MTLMSGISTMILVYSNPFFPATREISFIATYLVTRSFAFKASSKILVSSLGLVRASRMMLTSLQIYVSQQKLPSA